MIRTLPLCVAVIALLPAVSRAADEVFPVIHHEPIVVRILDGRTGKPQPLAHVVLVAGYNRSDLATEIWREEAITDARGEVQLSDALRNLPLLHVEVRKLHSCAPDAASAWSIERIRISGSSTANRCGPISAVDTPGIFAFSVKAGRAKSKSKSKQEAVDPIVSKPPAAICVSANPHPPSDPPLSEAEISQMLSEQN